MKNVLNCLLVLFLIVSLSACSANSNDIENIISKIDLEETYPSSPASLAVVYENIDEMLKDADAVVKGSVVDQEVVMLDGFPQTHTMIEVSHVLKGAIATGSSIEIIEEGGSEGKVMSGIPQLSKDYDYYLMLIEYKGSYYVCGAFQGRFVEREGYVFQQATSDVKLSKTYSPVSSEAFETMITNDLSKLVEK